MKWEVTEDPEALDQVLWIGTSEQGHEIHWKNFGTGPLTLTSMERATLCQKLLQTDLNNVKLLAGEVLRPFSGDIDKSLILHGTTSDLGAFQGDLVKLQNGEQPKNYAGYVEVRSVFLGKAGDMAVGRMTSWRPVALASGLEVVDISDVSHYYLSEALLLLAVQHLEKPDERILKIAAFLKKYPEAVVRLYVLDETVQIFLIWLKRLTGLDNIFIDANSPDVASNWNTKKILYPAIDKAHQLGVDAQMGVAQILEMEHKHTRVFQDLGLLLPSLPGYVIDRINQTQAEFTEQVLLAAELLQNRYGLEKACFKATVSGDGARITPDIDLKDKEHLKNLAANAYTYGDAYVLESHVHFETVRIGNEVLNLTPSAHIRGGKLAPGITLQFTKGTSWVGNIFVNENLAPQLNISKPQYHTIRNTMSKLVQVFQNRKLGLTIAGIDFAIGQIGGKFQDQIVLGIQDPNFSFNGAEFLRVFMTKTSQQKGWSEGQFYASTWVFVPNIKCSYLAIVELLQNETSAQAYSMAIAVVPGYWGMIGVAALNFELLVQQLEHLKKNIRIFSKNG